MSMRGSRRDSRRGAEGKKQKGRGALSFPSVCSDLHQIQKDGSHRSDRRVLLKRGEHRQTARSAISERSNQIDTAIRSALPSDDGQQQILGRCLYRIDGSEIAKERAKVHAFRRGPPAQNGQQVRRLRRPSRKVGTMRSNLSIGLLHFPLYGADYYIVLIIMRSSTMKKKKKSITMLQLQIDLLHL